MIAQPREIEYYTTLNGDAPFSQWMDSLNDPIGRAQVDARIARLRLGSLGFYDSVGEGVIELKFKNIGPGYRIYCAQNGLNVVLLLCAGTKNGQQADIERAKAYWREFRSRNVKK